MAIKIRQGTRNDPTKKRYYTITGDTREDVEKFRGSELAKRIRRQGVDNIEKQMEAQRQGEDVRYNGGVRLRLPMQQAEGAVNFMRRNTPKGPPAVRTTVSVGAYIRDGKVIRDGEE